MGQCSLLGSCAHSLFGFNVPQTHKQEMNVSFKNTAGLKIQMLPNGSKFLSTLEYCQEWEKRDQEQMYSWSNSLERRKYSRKQESCQTIYVSISLVTDNRKHTFVNKISMNRLLLLHSTHKKQLNQDWVLLGNDWKEKNHQ